MISVPINDKVINDSAHRSRAATIHTESASCPALTSARIPCSSSIVHLMHSCALLHSLLLTMMVILVTCLFPLTLGVDVLQLTNPHSVVTYAVLPLSPWQPLLTQRRSYCFLLWYRSVVLADASTAVVRLEIDTGVSIVVVWRASSHFFVIQSGEEIVTEHPAGPNGMWLQIQVYFSADGLQLTFGTKMWGVGQRSLGEFAVMIAPLRLGESRIILGADKDNPSSFAEFVDLKLLLDMEHASSETLEGLESVGYIGAGPSDRRYMQLASLGSPLVDYRSVYMQGVLEQELAVSGWIFVSESQSTVPILKIDAGESAAACDVISLQLTTDSALQACIQSSNHHFCLPPVTSPGKWTFFTVYFSFPMLQVCVGQLWTASVRCSEFSLDMVIGLKQSLGDYRAVHIAQTPPCISTCDVRLYLTPPFSTDTANEAVEEAETACVRACPLLSTPALCAAVKSRRTAITHYSAITFQQYMVAKESHYFTFVNTHAATVAIFFIGDNLGTPDADPDIFIYKPWNGDINAYDWKSDNWLTSSFTLLPTDGLLPSKGGIRGLYTLRVMGWNGGWTYEARVQISCSSVSLAACTCASGSYPNIDTSSCTSCPSTDNVCQVAKDMGCLPYSATSAAPSNMFNCQACFPAGKYLQLTTGTCLPCNGTCASCLGPGPAQCVTCKSNAALTGGIGVSTCVCVPGFYPNTTAGNCTACAPVCATCQAGTATDCLTCTSSAALVASAPASCQCVPGTFPSPDARLCPACDPHCATCVGGSANQCIGCKANASRSDLLSPSSCVCNSGFYENSANCQVCDASCKTCSAGGTSGCTACLSEAQLSSSPGPSACICNPGFYPSQSFCQPCNPSCSLCVGSSPADCTSCYPSASLVRSQAPSPCLCQSRFFPNPGMSHCTPCHASCSECSGPDLSECVSCWNFAELHSGVCVCEVTAFAQPDVQHCVQCDITCGACVSAGIAGCKACKAGAALAGASPNACECAPGYFPAPDASNCQQCNRVCASCRDSDMCLSCSTNAILVRGICECEEGFYPSPDAFNCVHCSENCQKCISAICDVCQLAFYSLNGQCYAECPVGNRPTASLQCEELDLSPPEPILTVTAENHLSLLFSKDMNFFNLTKSDLVVTVTDPDNIEIPVEWADPAFSGSQSVSIVLSFDVGYVPAHSSVTLTFLDRWKVVDIYGVPIEVTTLSGILNEQRRSQETILNTPIGASTVAIASSGTVASVCMSLLSGNVSLLTSLVNQLQLMSYIAMTKISLPSDLFATLVALNMGFVISSPFSSYIPKTSAHEPATHMHDYGVHSFLFFDNARTVLGTAVGVLLSYIPVFLLSRVKSQFVARYFQSLLPSLWWDTPMKLWLTSYLDLGVFSFIQLTYARESLNQWDMQLSLFFSVLFGLATLSTPFLVWSFSVRNFSALVTSSDPGFSRRWSVLTSEFVPKASSLLFYSFFTLRRLLFFLSLTVAQDYPVLIAALNCTLSLAINQVTATANETSMLLVYATVSAFLFEMSPDLALAIGMIGVWVARVALVANLGLSVYRTVLQAVELLKVYAKVAKLNSKQSSLKTALPTMWRNDARATAF